MRTPKDWLLTKPYPKVKKFEGKALERRKKMLDKIYWMWYNKKEDEIEKRCKKWEDPP